LSVQLKIKAVLSGVVLAGKISSTYPDEEQEHEPSAPVCETSEASASASRRLTELEESRMVVEQRVFTHWVVPLPVLPPAQPLVVPSVVTAAVVPPVSLVVPTVWLGVVSAVVPTVVSAEVVPTVCPGVEVAARVVWGGLVLASGLVWAGVVAVDEVCAGVVDASGVVWLTVVAEEAWVLAATYFTYSRLLLSLLLYSLEALSLEGEE
jgi:hypothetical protein